MRIYTALTFITCVYVGDAHAQNKIFYGSRAGMQMTILSARGINTDRAIIIAKHTREDAERFCVEYEGTVTESCINDQLDVELNDRVLANCTKGDFTDFYGRHYRFEGINGDFLGYGNLDGPQNKYLIRDISSGEFLDGSSASGYVTDIQIFRALCPEKAPTREDELQ
jgi:hypothetical protein